MALWKRFTAKNLKLLMLSRLSLILILISLGLINYGFTLKQQKRAQEFLNDLEPDYTLETKIDVKITETVLKLENLTEVEGIEKILYHRELVLQSVNNQTLIDSYTVSNIHIIGLSRLFFAHNNLEEKTIVEDSIDSLLKSNSTTNNFIMVGKEDNGVPFNYNLSDYDVMTKINITLLLKDFPMVSITDEYDYILMPIKDYITSIKWDDKKVDYLGQKAYLYLSHRKIWNLNSLIDYVNSTYDRVMELLKTYNLFSFTLFNNIYTKISQLKVTALTELKINALATLALFLVSVPVEYYSFLNKRERFKETIFLITAKGGTKDFFLRILTISEFLTSVSIGAAVSLIYALIEYLSFRKLSYIIYVIFYNFILLEILITYYLNTMLFKERKIKRKLKRTLKHKILVTLLKVVLVGMLIGALASLIFYLADIFMFENLKIIVYIIIIVPLLKPLKYAFGQLIRGIISLTSKLIEIKFGDIAILLKKTAIKANRSSTKTIIIFSFLLLFITASTMQYSFQKHQDSVVENGIGGDITLWDLKTGNYFTIAQEKEVKESMAIIHVPILPPLQKEIDSISIFFVERTKLKAFLHFNGLKTEYLQELEDVLQTFAERKGDVIISKSLEGILLDEENLNFFPVGLLSYEEIYLESKPEAMSFRISAKIDYMPFFSEQYKHWIIAPINGKYPLNLTFANMLMLKLKDPAYISSFQQKIEAKLPEIRTLTKADREEKEDKWLYTSLQFQTIIILIIGMAMLMEQSPEDYQKTIEILYSRGMAKKQSKKILIGYQVMLQTTLFLIAFGLGISCAWIITELLRSKAVFNYKCILNITASMMFLGGVILAQFVFYLQLKEKKVKK